MNWRLKLGVAVFILSILLPVAGIPLVPTFELSTTIAASVTAGLLVSAEVMGIVAIAIMGKPGYLYIKSLVFGFLKRFGPPEKVSRRRYNLGLIMFVLPILFGWLSIYLADYIPVYESHHLTYAIVGDIMLLTSLFVLGGDFWDKFRALFIYSDKVCSADS
jgi:hypothetical protein